MTTISLIVALTGLSPVMAADAVGTSDGGRTQPDQRGMPMTARYAPGRIKRLALLACVAVLVFLVGAFPAGAAPSPANATYRPIDYPGASQTWAKAVNRTSSIVNPVEVGGTPCALVFCA